MAEEKLNQLNPREQEILKNIQKLLGKNLKQLPKVGWLTPGYTINKAGAVVKLGLYGFKIDNEMLQVIAEPLTSLASLTWLGLMDNQVTNLAPLSSLTNLKLLDLDGNGLTDISPLKSLTSLFYLDLRNNQLTDLSSLSSMVSLDTLYLNNNQLTDLTELSSLTSLTTLSLSSNQLTDLPPLTSLTNLTGLDLDNNPLINLSTLASLTSLTDLSLIDNRQTDLSLLSSLTNLTVLDLKGNQLDNLSPLTALTNLTCLDLCNNQLTDLSPLGSLASLDRLYLDNNPLTDLSPLTSLASLTSLHLNNNPLIDLSPLTSLTSLTILALNNNKLTDLSSLTSLTNLTRLLLDENQVTDLSPLTSLTSLISLRLRNNHLKNIPLEFFNRDWEIHWKKENVPEGLDIIGNPLETPPVEIVKKGQKAIQRYFASLEGDKKKLNEAKILLVGTGGAGKTSLLKRIFGELFDGKESQTKGIVIRDKRYKVENQYVKAHFWDFGGQVIMHSSHQFFLSERSLYILVLDGRKEEDVEHWLQMIESFGGNSPILVVLNKMDENPGFDINQRFLQNKYKRILGFHRVSCKSQRDGGITNKSGIIDGIRTTFGEVEMIGSLWGANWFKVKNELEKIKTGDNPFIDSSAYQQICIKAGIIDTEDQEMLVDYLNDLGVILHFKDLELSDMHVLDPHWVTDAVYRIINSKKLADNHGQLLAGDLKTILKKRRTDTFSYPPGKHHYILKLMGKFELCYPMGDDGHVLVPDLQDVQEPKMPSFGDSPLRFYFEYSYLPSSVLPRFTVRMHHEIVGNFRWRTGLVVQNSNFNATAVVKSDTDRKRIYIEVYGDHKREYFSCIRRELFRIHDAFKKLDISQWIPLPDDENMAVTYANLYGHWKAGKKEFFNGETGSTYSVSRLLDGIETKEERLAGILQSMGLEAKHIKGKTLQDINILIQNINGDHAKGVQTGKMRDSIRKTDESLIKGLLENINVVELTKLLEKKKKG